MTRPTATDNCSGTITATTTSPLTYTTQGSFSITWTYTDAKGNVSTQNQNVVVNDNLGPVANVTSLPTITGSCSVTMTRPTATDNCSGTITATTPSPLTLTVGSYTITWTYTDAKGNISTQNQNVVVTPCSSIVNLKLFIEGYYMGGNSMTAVKINQGVGSSTTDVDNITVELRNATNYSVVASTVSVLKTDGTAVCTFSPAQNGSFYLVVKGRNNVQTWSANPVTVGANPLSYDFTTSANKAFGSNMVQLQPGVFGMYSGDVNQDEVIDGLDVSAVLDDIENSAFGFRATDINGDGSVDNSDTPALSNNAENSIFSAHP